MAKPVSYQKMSTLVSDLTKLGETSSTISDADAETVFNAADAIEWLYNEVERLRKNTVTERHRGTVFGYIQTCFANWPHREKFQPDNPERLRDWVRIRAGHCDVLDLPNVGEFKNLTKVITNWALTDEKNGKLRLIEAHEMRDGMLRLLRPKTMKVRGIGPHITKEEFDNLSRSIGEILEPIAGLSIDDYIHQKKLKKEKESNDNDD